ncbi:hypothetical protein TRFO_19730 [Tritrichomonas foetus]|uniref:Uncharacterized protein n=1 Tax=Tritrichomonas foetus TaxID=1144522 RepID=A0A1J4KI03_9EUKA|nr:hypothetical protein TRFO_19730 [Tritrichomonas foetus]|eukprot:OHT10843.1 hypothetical protein TRFO_19730 [Tritrichomonas foetus]
MKEELDPLLSKFSENAEFSATTTEIQDESIFTAGVGVEPTQPKTQPVRKAAAPKTKDVEDQPAAEEKPADEEKVNICQTGIIRIFSKNTI